MKTGPVDRACGFENIQVFQGGNGLILSPVEFVYGPIIGVQMFFEGLQAGTALCVFPFAIRVSPEIYPGTAGIIALGEFVQNEQEVSVFQNGSLPSCAFAETVPYACRKFPTGWNCFYGLQLSNRPGRVKTKNWRWFQTQRLLESSLSALGLRFM